MSFPAFSAQLKPFGGGDIFHMGMECLDLSDIAQVSKVSRSWKHEADKPLVWQQLSQRDGVPLVQSEWGSPRNRKEDFKALYPITLSGKLIGQYLGKVLGPIPPIQEKYFLRVMNELDPFEDIKVARIPVTSKIGRFFGRLLGGEVRMKETFRFMVIPSFVQRTLPADFPIFLDEAGNLLDSRNNPAQNGEKLDQERLVNIPFTLHNIKQLSLHPLGKDKDDCSDFVWLEQGSILLQCDSCAPRNSVYLMRGPVVEKSIRLSASAQESLVKAAGLEVTSIRVRMLYNLMNILRGNWERSARNDYVRFSERVPTEIMANVGLSVREEAHGRGPLPRPLFSACPVRGESTYRVYAGIDATASKHSFS